MNPATTRRMAALLLLLGVGLLAIRTWVGLDHPLPLGSVGDPFIIRANKLSGWFFSGPGLVRSPGPAAAAFLLWEVLPASIFGTGLLLWSRSASPTVRWPRVPVRVRLAFALVWLVAVASGLAWYCFDGIPHVQDNIAQQWQAHLFVGGHAAAPAPPSADQLANEFVVLDRGRWYAQYPPMQAVLLALGTVARVPWLIGSLAAAVSGYCLYRAAQAVYGGPLASVALALFSVSPFVWFMSAERMNHTAMLLFYTAALWAFAPALRRHPHSLSASRCGVGALLLGLTVSSRPLCGVAVAIPLLATVLIGRCERKRTWRTKPAHLVWLLGGLVLGALPLLLFNAATTGSPFRSGYEVQWGSSGWGFGKSQWGPAHTPFLGATYMLSNWDAAAKYLFEWPVPSLLPLVGLGAVRRRTPMDTVLLGTLLTLSLAYLPYFFTDHCLGPRFLYAGVPAFILLSARGLRGWGLYLSSCRGITPRGGVSVAARVAVVCCVVGLAVNVPLLLRWYRAGFWGTDTRLLQQVREQNVHHALVLIQDHNFARHVRLRRLGVSYRVAQGAVALLDENWIDREVARAAGLPPSERAAQLERLLGDAIVDPHQGHRRTRPHWIDYQGPSTNANNGFVANTPWPERQNVIYAVDLGTDNAELYRAFPRRQIWRYAYDATAKSFRLRQVVGHITSR